MKYARFQFLGYIIEYSPWTKTWQVLDWDFEDEYPIGPPHRSKESAMDWCCK